jgi:predicted DNA-binding protein (MmcQ/YjbR family)
LRLVPEKFSFDRIMNIEEVREYALSLQGVTEDQAFGEDILNFRLEGKIFVCLWLGGGKYDMKDGRSRIALKLSPDRNIELREQFSTVTPAYHWNKTHWSDVYYEDMDEALVKELIKESYRLIISKLPKTIRSKYIK